MSAEPGAEPAPGAEQPPGPAHGPTARRELALAVALCVVGGGLAVLAAGRPWLTETIHRAPLPDRVVRHTGSDLSAVPRALGEVAVAGALALVAARGRLRIALGALLVAVGAGLLAGVVVAVTGSSAGSTSGWPAVAGVGALLVVAGGALTVARGRRWAEMSARYDAPTARRARAVDPEVAQWEAFDRGDDPTR